MIILAFYGIHRYQLVWLYYRNKRKNEAHSEQPACRTFDCRPIFPSSPSSSPSTTSSLSSTASSTPVAALTIPRDRFEIQLLDDSTDETVGVASRHGRPLRLRHRQGLDPAARRTTFTAPTATASRPEPSKKGLKTAKGELIAIFDADFVPPPEWLMQSRIHHFAEPGDRHGANALDAPQPQLQLPHPGRSHSARRAFCSGARRPLPRGRLLQLQRHRRHVAASGHQTKPAAGSTTPSPKTPT